MNASGLKKILILSYFFPPCVLTAAQRSHGWARYLHRFGYYPIIITRNWERLIASPDDMHHDSGSQVIHQQHDGYEVWYVPFKGNRRDRLYARYGKTKYNTLRKALSYWELLAHHFITAVIPFKHIYYFADQYLKTHSDVSAMIVTGNPFEIFRFGYLLHRRHHIPWIADYRDDWTTSEVYQKRGLADSLLRWLERKSERRYISTAHCITSVSPYYAEKIGRFVKRPGHSILNGFVKSDFVPYNNLPLAPQFTIVYNGMLYPSQNIKVFLDAFKQLADQFAEHQQQLRLKFPGILFLKDVAKYVREQLKGYEHLLEMTERIPRQEVLNIQASAHLLLMVAHTGSKGIPSSKIYEYLALGKPVLICPGDDDILDQTFQPYNLGYIANTPAEAFEVLQKLFEQFLQGESALNRPDTAYSAQFSREIQVEKLAGLLDEMSLSTGNLSTSG
ncbi:MAG: glycosyltransferase [Bacteroidia bacterium]|nr:glycosyltransferase [Bacteroidia bacterium]